MFETIRPELIWFVVGFIFLLAELALPVFILLFFGIGAWFVAIAILIGLAPNINIQLLIFVISSLVTLFLFRKKRKLLPHGYLSGKTHVADSIGSVVGNHAIVIEDIAPHTFSGKVELHGTQWQATSAVPIMKGTEVEVIERINLLLKVKPIS